MKNNSEPFYRKGLQFECLKCGRCCTGFPGYVYLSEPDIQALAGFLHLSTQVFVKKYTRPVHMFGEPRLSLVEKPRFDCVFWDGDCTVYDARPGQCRTYPFWKRHLVSEREWNKLTASCPGVNRGRRYTPEEIERLIGDQPVYDLNRFTAALSGEPEK